MIKRKTSNRGTLQVLVPEFFEGDTGRPKPFNKDLSPTQIERCMIIGRGVGQRVFAPSSRIADLGPQTLMRVAILSVETAVWEATKEIKKFDDRYLTVFYIWQGFEDALDREYRREFDFLTQMLRFAGLVTHDRTRRGYVPISRMRGYRDFVSKIWGISDLEEPYFPDIGITVRELFVSRRHKSENAVDFFRRVWGEATARGELYQFQLAEIDAPLLRALKNYSVNHDIPMAEMVERGYAPPPKKAHTDALAEKHSLTLEEARRLVYATDKRRQRRTSARSTTKRMRRTVSPRNLNM